MPPARDLHRVGGTRPAPRTLRPTVAGPRRLPYRVGECFEIVAARLGRGMGVGEPDDFPSPGRGQPFTVLGAEVVAVGLGIGGERAEDRGRVGIDVRQCRDGGTAARSSRTATYRAHDVGRYRTLERAATTLSHLTPSCRPPEAGRSALRRAVLTCGGGAGTAGAARSGRVIAPHSSGHSGGAERSDSGHDADDSPESRTRGPVASPDTWHRRARHPPESRDPPGPPGVTLRR